MPKTKTASDAYVRAVAIHRQMADSYRPLVYENFTKALKGHDGDRSTNISLQSEATMNEMTSTYCRTFRPTHPRPPRQLCIASLIVFFACAVVGNADAQDLGWQPRNGQWVGDVRALCQAGDGSLLAGGEGINRTTDGGTTWTKGGGSIGINPVVSLQSIDDHLILAGTYSGGVFASTDFGNTWAARNQGLQSLTINALAYLPPVTVLAATESGLFLSKDSGATWHPDTAIGMQRILLVSTTKGGLIFSASQKNGIYWSSDTGAHWTNIGADVTGIDISSLVAVNDSLLIVCSDPLGIGAWVLSLIVRGDHWGRRGVAMVGEGYRPPPVSGMILCTDGTLLAATQGGIWKSTDKGENWSYPSNEATLHTAWVVIQRTDGSFVEGSPNCVLVSTDTARSWKQITHGLVLQNYITPPFATDKALRVYIASKGGIYRTTDGGLTWDFFWVSEENPVVSALAISPAGALFAATPSSGIYRSSDHGETWKHLTNGLLDDNILSLAMSTTEDMYAGSTIGIFQSTDGGDNWILANQMQPWGMVTSLLVSSSGSVIALSSPDKMLRSSDRGATWSLVPHDPFPDNGLWQEDRVAEGILGHLYADVEGTIFRSTDDGLTWAAFQIGLTYPVLPTLVINQLGELYGSNGTLWRLREKDGRWYDLGVRAGYLLGVDSAGFLWSSSNSGNSPQDILRSTGPSTVVQNPGLAVISAGFSLEQNFPNPFNPTTTIRYALSERSHVVLSVFSTLGQHVATLIDGTQDAGYHETKFDGTNLASGVYFYRIQAGSFVQMKKLLMVR